MNKPTDIRITLSTDKITVLITNSPDMNFLNILVTNRWTGNRQEKQLTYFDAGELLYCLFVGEQEARENKLFVPTAEFMARLFSEHLNPLSE
jgi:hypothetical protein